MQFLASADPLWIVPGRKNEVLVEWMDKSCTGQTNWLNMKQILANSEDVVGVILMAHIDSRCCKGLVMDHLEWSVPTKSKRKTAPKKSKKAAPGEYEENSA